MRYISLFSGVEAASVAWGPLGWEPVCFCEIDEFPSAVLAYRFPDVPNLGDITKVDWREVNGRYGSVDLIVGGSPCQSFSIAGGRDSLDGESRLMFEYIRALDEVRPTWFVWENVPGVLNTRDDAFAQLLREVQDIGYHSIAWRVLDAQFFGVAQRRRRVFLVGRFGEGGGAAAVLFDSESVRGNTQPSKQKREELARAAGICAGSGGFKFHQGSGAGGVGYADEQSPTLTADWHNPAVLAFNETQITSPQNGNVPQFGDSCHTLAAKDHPPVIAIQGDGRTSTGANGNGYKVDGSMYTLNVAFTVVATQDQTLIAPIKNDQTPKLGEVNDPMFTLRRGGQGGTIDCVADVGNYIVRRLTPRECERLQGFPDDWTLIPYRGKPAEECPDTPRYKAMGNSMAVPVMMWLGRRIGEVDRLEHDDRRC